MTLQEMRKRKSMTLQELAEASGVSPVHISRLEHGVCSIGKMTFATAARLADVLGVTLEELLQA